MTKTTKLTPITAATPAEASKRDLILTLLRRADGASLDEMVAATGWLPHTTRAMLTGLKKKGYVLTSEKTDNIRRYRVMGSPAQ
jgi:DNA-binding MarR family transcriptional regulator